MGCVQNPLNSTLVSLRSFPPLTVHTWLPDSTPSYLWDNLGLPLALRLSYMHTTLENTVEVSSPYQPPNRWVCTQIIPGTRLKRTIKFELVWGLAKANCALWTCRENSLLNHLMPLHNWLCIQNKCIMGRDIHSEKWLYNNLSIKNPTQILTLNDNLSNQFSIKKQLQSISWALEYRQSCGVCRS